MKITSPLLLSAALSFSAAFILAGCGEQAAGSNRTQAVTPTVKAKEPTTEEYFAKLHKQAEAGNAEAQFNLGWIYMHGEGYTGVVYMRDVPRDVARAFDWYQKAAVQGHANAQYNLGMLYNLGLGMRSDADKAFMWLQKAAAQGNDLAQYNLGMMYADGAGVKRNLPRASAWLALAAAQGNEKAKKSQVEIDANLTPAQRDEGRQLAAGWKKGDVMEAQE